MKTAVSRYGFINAKLRARISDILPEKLTESLIQTGSLEETFQVLRETPFAPLAEAYDRTGDLQYTELELFRMQIAVYREIVKYATDSVQEFVKGLSLKLEVENFKNVLRLWFGSKVKKRPISHRAGYLYTETILHPLDWDRIINAETFQELTEAVDVDLYRRILEPFLELPLEEIGIFKIETSLDRMYYRTLFEKSAGLPRRDRELVEKILRTEIDLQNISWLIRYSHFYKVDAAGLSEILIPLGRTLEQKDIEAYLSQEGRMKDPAALLKGRFPALASLSLADRGTHAAQALLFEQLLDETTKTEFIKLISGYPFTIGIILVYFFMKSRESRFIMGVLNGKYYGLKPDRIRDVTG